MLTKLNIALCALGVVAAVAANNFMAAFAYGSAVCGWLVVWIKESDIQ